MKLSLIVLLIVVLGSLLGLTAWRWISGDQTPDRSTPPTDDTTAAAPPPASSLGADAAVTTFPPAPQRVAYVVSRPNTGLTHTEAETATPIAGGVLLPVLEAIEGRYRIFDPCNREGWVSADEVETGLVTEEREGGFDQAVFVLDPGHGLPDYGAIGPSGLAEAEVNLDVAARAADLLRSSHDVDWATGDVGEGDEIPAAATTVLTRSPDGPHAGQYQLGLTFRATVANALKATALVSIHHNTSPETTLDHPGSEAFVSLADPESPRLGALMVDELRRGFSRFEADWTGSTGSGLISRVNGQGKDYYSVLARSEVPAAIVEGVYISNPTEEALAMTDEFRQAYAEGIYRALVRFVTTDDYPIPSPEPDLWEVDRPGPSMSDCRVPPP